MTFRGKRVLVTGHTGFKGAWLSEWLLLKGARVSGIALPPESADTLFDQLGHSDRVNHAICDIRDAAALRAAVKKADPEVIFHLAAQSLVLRSYAEPERTWHTNVLGTINLLEAARELSRAVSVVVVTTDKVYRNREWEYPYREEDELGGRDPYSASKAACELAVASWRDSFGAMDGVSAVTARAGNVIGAGDMAQDRIVPDCFRAWNAGKKVQIRNPESTRPWQHVLEPLSGYLAYSEHIAEHGTTFNTCNFGPGAGGDRTVESLVRSLAGQNSARQWERVPASTGHEAAALSLAVDRARSKLGWEPTLSFDETVAWTDEGYTVPTDKLAALVVRQIAEYEALATGKRGEIVKALESN